MLAPRIFGYKLRGFEQSITSMALDHVAILLYLTKIGDRLLRFIHIYFMRIIGKNYRFEQLAPPQCFQAERVLPWSVGDFNVRG